MSLTCELSGEPIATTKETVVATPSGHICIKRLILQKLTENGGMDPFETIRERPLSEDQLIELHKRMEPPPRPQATSFPNLLHMMQTEYDALVLELFDTRRALEDTRRELSQALYQNDAAVRVVARLSMERDAARQELEQWNASVGAAPAPTTDTADATVEVSVPAAAEEPQSKRRKVERPDGPLSNDMPEEDFNAMLETWQTLHPNRKPLLKAAAAQAPTLDTLGSFAKNNTKKWHKSTCRAVVAMARDAGLLVTAGKDKQVVVYSIEEEVVKHTFSVGGVPTCVGIRGDVVVVGVDKGKVVAYSLSDGSTLGALTLSTEVVAAEVHPTGKHICVATSDGSVAIGLLEGGTLSLVSTFKGESSVEYTCGALHPDGLLYAAGTKAGDIHMWDFKNKVLASTLKVRCFCSGMKLPGLLVVLDGLNLALARCYLGRSR